MRGNQGGFTVLHIFLVLLLAGVLGAAGYYAWNQLGKGSAAVSSFEECVAAGNPVMESFPEQCRADGQTFVNEQQVRDLGDREQPEPFEN